MFCQVVLARDFGEIPLLTATAGIRTQVFGMRARAPDHQATGGSSRQDFAKRL